VIARSLAPIAVGVVRRPECNPRPDFQHEALVNGKMKSDAAGIIPHATPHIYPPKKSKFSVWVANSNTEEIHGTVKLRYISIATGKDVRDAESISVVVKELGTTEVVTNADCPEDEPTVVAATFLDRSGTLVSRESDWPQPLKHMTFPDRQIRVELVGEEVHLCAQKPVKGLVLLNDGVQWSDNCLDIIPGDKQRVTAAGLKANVQFIYYGKDW
jgi:beta-mannosidase